MSFALPRRCLVLIPLLASMLLLAGTPAAAAGLDALTADNGAPPRVFRLSSEQPPRVIGGLSLALSGASPAERARAFAERYRELLLPGAAEAELRVLRTVARPSGRAVQLIQQLEGIEVFGGSLVVGFDLAGRTRLVVNSLRPTADQPLIRDVCSPETAIDRARTAFTADGRRLRGVPRAEPIWLPVAEGLARAHRVTVPGAVPLGDFAYLVGGIDGRILAAYGRTPGALGYAYRANPVRGTWEQVELPYLTSTTNLIGEYVESWSCTGSASDSCTPVQRALPDADGNYLIEPTGANDPNLADDLFVEVQAYYAINAIHDYFVAQGEAPSPLKIGVNYPMPDAYGPNAYYSEREQAFGNGPAIMIGQWRDIDLALDNDVIFHEYGHHVFGENSSAGMFELDQYGPTFLGLAFNEASADYFSCSALEDPVLGEYFASRLPQILPDGYLRKVDNDLVCPDGLYGEGHDDGMVWSGFLWEVRTLLGQAVADPLYLDVITHFPTTLDFPTVIQVYLERAALVLDATTVEQVRAIAERRGLIDCRRYLVPLKAQAHVSYLIGREMLGQYASMVPHIPSELQYVIEVPAEADRLELHLSTRPYSNLDARLLVRADQPNTHAFSFTTGLSSAYDFVLPEADGIFDLQNPDPASPFEPGHTYYFQLANFDQRTGECLLRGGFALAPQDGGTDGGADGGADAGLDGGGDGGDGGCPEGWDWAFDGEQMVCVPVCREGFEAKLDPASGQWVCEAADSGCGCTSAAGGGWLLMVGLLLLLGARRRRAAATT